MPISFSSSAPFLCIFSRGISVYDRTKKLQPDDLFPDRVAKIATDEHNRSVGKNKRFPRIKQEILILKSDQLSVR